MNTLPRNPTVYFSRETEEYSYEAEPRTEGHQDHGWRIFSTRRSSQINLSHMRSSFSYRRERARKRHIFLQTYKLGSISSREKFMKSRKLKKVVVKVQSAVMSVLAFMRGGVVRSCGSGSAIRASSPTRVAKFC
ncbi:hypothetical protein CDL12_21172 [Handroanthus impetiginosus]|uniref:Uncharacterized protein n=1 Tax=Handroanthus impetiginosus TaxID=429701 RepID=A0A2G9G3Y7_9LAMI|nr:hypothetical protein CDL12_27885 [Handroanthus impetiginosus]PIM99620.1 hypothetical protein CDL12_27886 [Handroanthus impetiginosus]PIN06272.1 hypothetical protein CDL12_21172 [Handroanthus impetiginosus]